MEDAQTFSFNSGQIASHWGNCIIAMQLLDQFWNKNMISATFFTTWFNFNLSMDK